MFQVRLREGSHKLKKLIGSDFSLLWFEFKKSFFQADIALESLAESQSDFPELVILRNIANYAFCYIFLHVVTD